MRKYQYYNLGDDGDRDGYGVNWVAQTFTPETAHMISKVKLKLFVVGDPGTITVSIKNTTNNKPSGADLCEGTIKGTDITVDTNGEWYEITLGDGYTVEKDVEYAIVVRAPDGDAGNKVSWRSDGSSPTYTRGLNCLSSDSGVDWDTYSGVDCMFEEWGVGPPSPGTVVWGNLPKSQISIEKIEEAITRLIQTHEDDPDSHLEEGESLYSHKASEIIDHIVNSIIADKIKDGEITTDKLENLAVTNAKIANATIETGKIKDLQVTTAKIASLAVEEAKIGSLAVTELKIGNLAITVGKIGNQAVETGKLKDLAVTNAKIANATIEEAKIKNLAVTNAKIANATITDAKISDLTVEKLTGTYLTGKTVRTAASGKRVEMRGANNDLAFYDVGGNLGGTILGQSGKIYISGAGLDVECKLWMEEEFIPDTIRTMIPSSSLGYDIGTSTYYWRDVFLRYLKFHSSYGKIYHGTTEILDFYATKLMCKKPFGFQVRAGTPGAASAFQGHMYYDTNETDLVFSNGVNWYKVSAEQI